jgi:hypothetical protein
MPIAGVRNAPGRDRTGREARSPPLGRRHGSHSRRRPCIVESNRDPPRMRVRAGHPASTSCASSPASPCTPSDPARSRSRSTSGAGCSTGSTRGWGGSGRSSSWSACRWRCTACTTPPRSATRTPSPCSSPSPARLPHRPAVRHRGRGRYPAAISRDEYAFVEDGVAHGGSVVAESCEKLFDDAPVGIGQPVVAAPEAEGRLLVVEAEPVRDGGVDVVDGRGVRRRRVAEVVGGPERGAALEAAAGQERRVSVDVVVPAGRRGQAACAACAPSLPPGLRRWSPGGRAVRGRRSGPRPPGR